MPPNQSPRLSEPTGFYEEVLSRAERMRLSRARQVEGLDEEIALLRVRLSRLVQEHPEKLELLLKGINLLVRAVSIKYKLSPQSERDLSQSIANVLRGIGTFVLPEETNGG